MSLIPLKEISHLSIEEEDKALKYYNKVIEIEPRTLLRLVQIKVRSLGSERERKSSQENQVEYMEYYNRDYEYYGKALEIDPHKADSVPVHRPGHSLRKVKQV